MKKLKQCLGILSLLLLISLGAAGYAQAAVTTITPKQTAATTGSITISWSAVSGADHYQIRYILSGSGDVQTISNLRTTSYTFSGLATDTAYSYTVQAYALNGTQIGASSTKTMAVAPGPVTTLSPKSWSTTSGYFSIPSNPYQNVMEGIQWQLLNRTGKKVVASGETTFKGFYASAKPNQTYILNVRGYTTVDYTKFYGPWSKKVVVPQPAQNKLKLVKGKNAIKVSWKKVAGATKYVIYGSTSASSGYKKVATVNGKKTSCSVTKVKGKKLVRYKNYYFKVVAYKGKVKSPDTAYRSGFIYLTYK